MREEKKIIGRLCEGFVETPLGIAATLWTVTSLPRIATAWGYKGVMGNSRDKEIENTCKDIQYYVLLVK
jgi:hypothetical protein